MVERPKGRTTTRCAIYTRKSTEEGLEQDFNSLHAQREACEAFISSQRHEGWKLIETAFDDGGFSGGSMNRPALQRLLEEVRGGRIDTVVVYKVDRLTRSLADFAKIIEMFDSQGASFVSVTQQFNTTTSMGRLTLNILLSFAQFERELTGERVRDKIAASKKKGLWMGGYVPLGYRANERTLAINESEAEIIRTIYTLYIEREAVAAVQAELLRQKVVRPIAVAESGHRYGGKPFGRGLLYGILSNPIYVGEIAHRENRYEGQHQAIIDRETWDAVQAKLAANRHERSVGTNSRSPSLLAGILYDGNGNRLTPTHANKKGKRYRYYALQSSSDVAVNLAGGTQPAERWRIPAAEIEGAVFQQICLLLTDKQRLLQFLGLATATPDVVHGILHAAENLAGSLPSQPVADQRLLLLTIVNKIVVTQTELQITLKPAAILDAVSEFNKETSPYKRNVSNSRGGDANRVYSAPTALPESETISTPITFGRRGVETKLIIQTAEGASPAARVDLRLIKAVARAHVWFGALSSGKAHNLSDIAKSESLDVTSVCRLLPLAFLSPAVVDAVLEGSQSPELNVWRLIRKFDIPISWNQQTADSWQGSVPIRGS